MEEKMKKTVGRKNRQLARFGCIALLSFFFAVTGVVCAQAESYESLYPCFIDIQGWKGEEPEGAKMEMPGMKMINAVRGYEKGDKEIKALIIIGNPAMAGYAAPQGMMNMETDDMRVNVKTIRGFQVSTVYDKKEKSGAVTVILLPSQDGGGAIFSLAYENMSDDEALDIAQSFDWSLMKDTAQSF
jgi:hypothetical protein